MPARSQIVPKVVEWDKLTRPPWERLPGESSRAYAYFATYRDIGPYSRSMRAAATMIEVTVDALREHATRWHWKFRVESYDDYTDALARQAQEEELKAMNARHVRTGQLMLNKALQKLVGTEDGTVKPLDVDRLDVADIIALANVGAKLERLAMGAETERVGLHTTETHDVKIGFDFTPQYPVDPAAEIIEGEFKEITSGEEEAEEEPRQAEASGAPEAGGSDADGAADPDEGDGSPALEDGV